MRGEIALLEGHGDEIRDVLVGDDHTAGVLAGVSNHSLDDAALVVDRSGDGIFVHLGGQFGGFFHGILQRDVQLVGDHLGQLIGLGIFDLVDPGEVADDHLRAEGAEGDDVGDAVFPVFIADVGHHLIPPAHAEVDVEVGWRDALKVEHALKKQAEAERVDVGDFENIGDETAGTRTPPRADRDALPRAQSMKSQTIRK